MAHGKGANFEREICVKLSRWWMGLLDKLWEPCRDDIFWRSHGSGGRATNRSRFGKSTFGQEGDITATDPIGQPLMDIFGIEIKKGYNEHTIADSLDRPANGSQRVFEGFIQQAYTAHINSRSMSWMLIHERNLQSAMVYTPMAVINALYQIGVELNPIPRITYTFSMPLVKKTKSKVEGRKTKKVTLTKIGDYEDTLIGVRLHDFLSTVSPDDIKILAKQHKRNRV